MAKPWVVCPEPALGFTFPGASAGFPEVQGHEEGEHQRQQDSHHRAGNDELPVALGALEQATTSQVRKVGANLLPRSHPSPHAGGHDRLLLSWPGGSPTVKGSALEAVHVQPRLGLFRPL